MKKMRKTSRRITSMLVVLAMVMTVLIQFPTKAYASSTLELQMYNGNTNASTNTLNPNFKLINTGNEAIDLSTVKIKYYFTKDTNETNLSQIFTCDFCSAGTEKVTSSFHEMTTTTDTADTYVEIGFTSGTLYVGGDLQLQARIYNNHWSNYTQTNDYSFNDADTAYSAWSKVPVYVGTTLYGTEPIATAEPDPEPNPIVYPEYDSNKDDFLIIVGSSLFSSIATRLNTYVNDVFADGYNSTVITVSNNANDQSADYICATAPELKNVIKSYYNDQTKNYKGFVFIGSYPEIPIARWTKVLGATDVEISDYYYADLDVDGDGVVGASEDWTDANDDGVFEVSNISNGTKTPQISAPEMFYGRIDAGGKSDLVSVQAEKINGYFDKLNGFRAKRSEIINDPKSALGFVDDDWSYWYETDSKLRAAFDDVNMIQEDFATTADVIDSEYSNDYYFMDILTHGGPDGIYPVEWDKGIKGGKEVSRETIEQKGVTDPKAYYIHSFGCCTSKYVEKDRYGVYDNQANLGASYLFDNENTVNVSGVCGSIWNNLSVNYFRNLSSKSIGEAYRLWVKECYEMDLPSRPSTQDTTSWECAAWYVLLGDPTLRHPLQPKTDSCPGFEYPTSSDHFQTLNLNLGEQFTKVIYPVDEDNDLKTVELTQAPGGATLTLNPDESSYTISWRPSESDLYGNGQKFVIKLTDLQGNTYKEQFNVYVNFVIPPQNMSFENITSAGMPAGWDTWKWADDRTTFECDNITKKAGDYSAKMTLNIVDAATFTKKVPVKKNTNYRVGGWIRTQDLVNYGDKTLGAFLRVTCAKDTNKNQTDTYTTSNYIVGDTDWTYVELEFNSGRNALGVLLECGVGDYDNASEGTAWFDDLTFEEIQD